MFGYITADLSSLTDEQKSRYRGCYCGLCHVLGSEYGTVHRLTLNYDLTFLALILSSLYESQETEATARCLAHPLTTHHFWMTDATKYAAAMNIALSYHKMIDDWNDSLIRSSTNPNNISTPVGCYTELHRCAFCVGTPELPRARYGRQFVRNANGRAFCMER